MKAFTNKLRFTLSMLALAVLLTIPAIGQDYEYNSYQIRTIFKPGHKASGGFGALENKFTKINGEYANLAGIYGGWYINHRFLLGVAGAALTNNIRVPEEYSVAPGVPMSYQYGQFGLMTEYTLWSHRAVHFSIGVMNGAGFTVQYLRHDFNDDFDWNYDNDDYPKDTNFFFVSEPSVRLEMNIFKWMRFTPGVSYRYAYSSDAEGLSDDDINGISYNLTLKFGKF
jgi:hypothetical protein